MFSNRKGISQGELVALILVVFVLVAFFLIYTNIQSSATPIYNKEICKASVEANARRLEIAGTEITPGLSDLKCPTRDIVVKDPTRIQLTLANQMYDCWDQYGRGALKFLPDSSQTYCLICSKVSFDSDASGKQLNGFLQYLAQTQIRDDNGLPVPGVNYTYLQFLQGFETKPDELSKIKATQGDTIDTTNKYAVTLIYYKQQNWGRPANAALGGIAGCTLGGVAGVFGIILSGAAAAPVIAPVYLAACGGGIFAGSSIGWMSGHDSSADWGSRVVTVPYQNLDKLGCTALD